jgi:Cu-processing system permease protein
MKVMQAGACMDRVLLIALTTFRESVRSRVLYLVAFCAVILVAVAALFGTVTIGDQLQVIKDFGLFSVSLCPVGFAVIAGSALLHKELAKKTVYNILAKPVPRYEFILGKYLGMLATSTLLLMLLGIILSLFVMLFGGAFDASLLQGYLFSFFELVIVCAAAIFFSSCVVTPLLSGLFTFGVFLAGRSTEYLLYFVKEGAVEGLGRSILQALYYALPHLNDLNIANELVYGKTVTLAYTLYAGLYAVGYAGVLLVLAQMIFNKREFN